MVEERATERAANRVAEVATLAGGCFWCLEAVYNELDGVLGVESGYMGGSLPNPSYEDVCTGRTGHAEVVQITFDPQRLAYADLLRVFFTIHDPTTRNRQGNDVGTQYRSAIFVHSAEQEATARRIMLAVGDAGVWPQPLVTEISAAGDFYGAGGYHQEYYVRNPQQGYCTVVVAPKVAKFRKQWQERLKGRQSPVSGTESPQNGRSAA